MSEDPVIRTFDLPPIDITTRYGHAATLRRGDASVEFAVTVELDKDGNPVLDHDALESAKARAELILDALVGSKRGRKAKAQAFLAEVDRVVAHYLQALNQRGMPGAVGVQERAKVLARLRDAPGGGSLQDVTLIEKAIDRCLDDPWHKANAVIGLKYICRDWSTLTKMLNTNGSLREIADWAQKP